MHQLHKNVQQFRNIARLDNGFFCFPAEAVEFARWTMLRQQLQSALSLGIKFLPDGSFVQGVIGLIDRVECVAAHGQL